MGSHDFSSSLRPVHVELELRFGTHSERVTGLLVGQRQGEYLVVELSKKHNWKDIQEWFPAAASVVVRGLLEQGEVIAGKTRYLNLVARPQRMVYLSYPSSFETRSLRQTPRVEVELDAILRGVPGETSPFPAETGITEVKGRIKDVSRGGMSFETGVRTELNADDFNGVNMEVEVYDEGVSLLKTVAEIRGYKITGDVIFMGLLVDRAQKQFVESLDHLILHSKTIKQAIKG